MKKNPYSEAPTRAFWSRSMKDEVFPAELTHKDLIGPTDKVASAGSCFASNLVPFLEKAGIPYVRAEEKLSLLRWIPGEAYGYDSFSAAYGNIYTARQWLQLLRRALGKFKAKEDRWHEDGRVIDPFRPGLRYAARSDEEFDALTRQHLCCVIEAVKTASVFVFTLGLTEAWESKLDGAVYPACPGTIAGTFDPARHVFRNFTVSEIVSDLNDAIAELRGINPGIRVILTVSPVPLVATATDKHVLLASIYSKSVLRVAAEEVCRASREVDYFPAYELVTGPQAPADFFAPDYRNVTQKAVDFVMGTLLANVMAQAPADGTVGKQSKADAVAALSSAIVEFECEELMMDRRR